MAEDRLEPTKSRKTGHWWPLLLGVVLVLFGLPIAVGGLWLITLGGSWWDQARARSMLRTCAMPAAASRSWPTTSPITRAVAPSGRTNASYQSPPTWEACGAGR